MGFAQHPAAWTAPAMHNCRIAPPEADAATTSASAKFPSHQHQAHWQAASLQ